MKELYRYVVEYPSEEEVLGIRLKYYRVIKETDSSFLIDMGKLRWVRKGSLRGYAKVSKEEALDDLKRRLTKQIEWNKFWLKNQERALKTVNKMTSEDIYMQWD